MKRQRILLICMPWAAVFRPALGISLIKSSLEARGIQADIRYFNLLWAEEISKARSERLNGNANLQHVPFQKFSSPGMVDEWVFSRHLFGEQALNTPEYIHSILKKEFSPEEIEFWISLTELVEPFLAKCYESVNWDDYGYVGFTSTFRQNAPSLALAKLIKQRHPGIKIIMGGGNCEGEMGKALLRLFDCLDYVVSGQGDESVYQLMTCVSEGREPEGIRGVIWRKQGVPELAPHPAEIEDLDTLPSPNFDDYFHEIKRTSFAKKINIRLALEQSRGCWWGMRKQCTFCGLNGKGISFRAKSAERALEELFTLGKRYGVPNIDYTDNILCMKYFETLLPRLAALNHPFSLFYEIKSNLRKAQLEMLMRAGVKTVQPGIESLSTHVLKLMSKGTTMLQNVQCLKWCHQFGIESTWNVLYGFPGETPEDYKQMLPIFESISHLPAPVSFGQLRMDRFSPNFKEPEKRGFTNVRPARNYAFVYPFPQDDLAQLCYMFDFDYIEPRDPESYVADVKRFLVEWQRNNGKGSITHSPRGNQGAIIRDRRFNRPPTDFLLSPIENKIFVLCDETRSLDRIQIETGLPISDMRPILDQFVEEKLMVHEDDCYLSVVPIQTGEIQPLACGGSAGYDEDTPPNKEFETIPTLKNIKE